MQSKSSLRSPLGRVRGLGSAHSGFHHWWIARLTSLALIPLSLWFLVVLCTKLIYADRVAVADWFASPSVTILMLSFLIALITHTKLGLQVVIEDYVHHEGRKLTLLLLNSTLAYGLLVISVFALAKLHFIGI